MSPPMLDGSTFQPGFPRVSGDEPMRMSVVRVSLRFSPRERG